MEPERKEKGWRELLRCSGEGKDDGAPLRAAKGRDGEFRWHWSESEYWRSP